MYAALSQRIAEDPTILALATGARAGQPPVNLLLGAVHYLLLGGARYPLGEYYRSVGGPRSPNDAYPVFVDFCRKFESEIIALVGSRRVQTNEVRRCGLLLPAITWAWQRSGCRPVSLIEIGCSAGLNLLLDRYRYEYGDGSVQEASEGPIIRTELRGDGRFPWPTTMPEIVSRTGIDLEPVDVTDPDSVRWIEALIWPDQLDRLALYRQAIAVAREAPPRILAGDGLSVAPGLIQEAPPGSLVCVFHSHAIYQMDPEWRREFDRMIEDLARVRDVARVSLEWLGDDPGPRLHVSHAVDGDFRTVHLADCDHHGAWIRWVAR